MLNEGEEILLQGLKELSPLFSTAVGRGERHIFEIVGSDKPFLGLPLNPEIKIVMLKLAEKTIIQSSWSQLTLTAAYPAPVKGYGYLSQREPDTKPAEFEIEFDPGEKISIYETQFAISSSSPQTIFIPGHKFCGHTNRREWAKNMQKPPDRQQALFFSDVKNPFVYGGRLTPNIQVVLRDKLWGASEFVPLCASEMPASWKKEV
jgi:hypothetical protein